MYFGLNGKLTRDCISLYNNDSLISGGSEDIAIEIAVFNHPLLFDALSPGFPREYLHELYIARNLSHRATVLLLIV